MPRSRFDRGATRIDFFSDLEANVAQALGEDLGAGDLTAVLLPAGCQAQARVIVREDAVLCGTRWFEQVLLRLAADVRIDWRAADGDRIAADSEVCVLAGDARAIVSGERTALNFLQTLSGTATCVARHVAQLVGTRTRLLDTRKTIPGLRRAQKYAVRCGGGFNHRGGLHDGILVKENHIEAAGGITTAVAALRALHADVPIEVEVETLAQIEEAIAAGADMLLLDNFPLDRMQAAVRQVADRIPLEASGGFGFDDLPAIAATGVDFVSVGGLTKHLRATDFSLRIVTPR
jgi:nicotinate-nucleotide pyrophosphorylase (carboxylating)